MAYTVRKLITNAYYLSNVVSRTLQTVSGQQITDGLDLLNDLIAIKTVNNRLIPYYKKYSFAAVPNQEKYFIPNLISAETFTFYLDGDKPVRLSTQKQQRMDYFGSPRADVSALPFYWHLEREKGGANIYLYFFPNTNYPLEIWGKFSLTEVSLDEDLSLSMDRFYITYLRYALAEYICQDYGITFQAESAKQLQEYEKSFIDISPLDLTMQKASTLNNNTGISWGFVNLGKGWTT